VDAHRDEGRRYIVESDDLLGAFLELMAAERSALAHSRSTGLEAPMTGEIERQLELLIRKFGYRKVREALTPLINKCAFSDWRCVANAVERLARKARRSELTKR
jgi:hypothetical protein